MAPLPRRGQQVRPSEREVVLVRSSSSMPWGLQLEYQLYRTPEDSREWGCFAVVECARGSPASLQLRIGDLLVGVDGRKVKSSSRDDFAELLSTLHSKGRAVFLTVASKADDDVHEESDARTFFDGDDDGVRLVLEGTASGATLVKYLNYDGDDQDQDQDRRRPNHLRKSVVSETPVAPVAPEENDEKASPPPPESAPDEPEKAAAAAEEPEATAEGATVNAPPPPAPEDETSLSPPPPPGPPGPEDETEAASPPEEEKSPEETPREEPLPTSEEPSPSPSPAPSPSPEEPAAALKKPEEEDERAAFEEASDDATPEAFEAEGWASFEELPEDDVGRSAAVRLKFVPLDDELCRGARFAGSIDRPDGVPRTDCYAPLEVGEDVLVAIDDQPVIDLDYAALLARLRRAPPLTLRFVKAPAPVEDHDDTTSDERLQKTPQQPSFFARLFR